MKKKQAQKCRFYVLYIISFLPPRLYMSTMFTVNLAIALKLKTLLFPQN